MRLMTMPTAQRTVQAQLHWIDEISLEAIAFKLMHPEPGQRGLSAAQADDDIVLYRCFLKLGVLCPATAIVPTVRIDRVWHAHILDTAKYRADCDRVFGRFLDHFPYAGLRGEEDERAWRASFAETCRLFMEHFGVQLGSELAPSVCINHGDGSDCVTPDEGEAWPRPVRGTLVARTGV
jgi:hypothetical protein